MACLTVNNQLGFKRLPEANGPELSCTPGRVVEIVITFIVALPTAPQVDPTLIHARSDGAGDSAVWALLACF